MQPDLNRLRIFSHVHSHLSITDAADDLHITPSAVSQQLKKLEAELKTQLFTRLHKRLVPTPAGKRLFALVQPLLNELQEGIVSLEQERTEPTGLLKIGSPVEFGSIYLPRVMASFREKYEKVTFDLLLGRPSDLLPKVNSGDLDFAFIDTFPTRQQHYSDYGNFSITPVIEEEVVLACSKQFFENRLNGDISYTNLANSIFVSQQHDARALNNWFMHHFGKSVTRLEIALTVASHQAVVSSVRNHLGLGIIVTHLVWKEIQSGNIVVIKDTDKQAINRISTVQLQDKIPTISEKAFLSHFYSAAKNSKTLRRFNLCVDERVRQ